MIIKKLSANNFLKYSSLTLDNVPENGIIAVCGDNESGKSAIGEAVCFALFGRTYTLTAEKILKSINWGSDKTTVTLEFKANNNNTYRINRYISDEGYLGAELLCTDENSEILSGIESVNNKIIDLLEFDFSSFIESYYLPQAELNLHYDNNNAIRKISELEKVDAIAADIDKTIKESNELAEKLGENLKNLEYKLKKSKGFKERIKKLSDNIGDMERTLDIIDKRRIELNDAKAIIPKNIEEIKDYASDLRSHIKINSYSNWLHMLEFLREKYDTIDRLQPEQNDNENDILEEVRDKIHDLETRLIKFEELFESVSDYREKLAVMLGESCSSAKTDTTESPLEARNQLKHQIKNGRKNTLISMLFFIGISTGTILLLTLASFPVFTGFIYSIIGTAVSLTFLYNAHRLRLKYFTDKEQLELVELRIKEIQRRADEIDSLIEKPLGDAIAFFRNFEGNDFAEMAEHYLNKYATPLSDNAQIRNYCKELAICIRQSLEPINNSLVLIEKEQEELRHKKISLSKKRADLKEELEQEKLEHIEPEILEEEINKDNQTRNKHYEIIRLLNIATTEIAAFSAHLRFKFSKAITASASEILPALTDNNYQSLKIGHNFDTKVFSEKKSDFMEIEELSSGSRRQMAIALRLALCNALSEKTGAEVQYIFLDEPFAFFDSSRVKSTIDSLKNNNALPSQIFVVSQQFEDETLFDMIIKCHNSDIWPPHQSSI